jgi:hypothetical protein
MRSLRRTSFSFLAPAASLKFSPTPCGIGRPILPRTACHGGPIEAPVLSEQRPMFASGQRRNDVYGRMRAIAAGLTDDEISGLAAYYPAVLR